MGGGIKVKITNGKNKEWSRGKMVGGEEGKIYGGKNSAKRSGGRSIIRRWLATAYHLPQYYRNSSFFSKFVLKC